MDKHTLSERDVCTKFITPALVKAKWDLQTQIREEVTFTAGRVLVRGAIAIIEAKENSQPVGTGMQQALSYAETLEIPFVFSSNGDAFLHHDRTMTEGAKEIEMPLEEFPTPEELWQRYCTWKGIHSERQGILTQDYYTDGSGRAPRYYQQIAINRSIEAIAKGQNRILLVMATGTGKTYTAFQIIWCLWKSRTKKRILFLADRNILVDQTMTNDFKPFAGLMTKIKKRQVDKSYEVYLALYQAVSGSEEWQNIYRQFTPDFFDLVVVDECHRGSAAEDAAWREVLEYFSNATQIGMTATPKETKYVSNIYYFGEPVYTYSLRQGIDDGFLAPYRVVRIDLDKDLTGWRPEKGKRDKYDEEIEDRIYNQQDFDRSLVLEKRTELVAKKVSEFLKATNRFDKTIVFCENIDHAERMRSLLVNENTDLVAYNSKYVMRITGDNSQGKMELDNFIDPESKYPVIATTSKLMTTGVDAQTCKLIVLDQRIQSMTEFKQIIGRGTRIHEDYDKFYFTIMDFKKATELFADPDFDGDPVQVYEPGPDDPVVPPDVDEDLSEETGDEREEVTGPDALTKKWSSRKLPKYYVRDVEVNVASERVQYYDKDGKLITESLRAYTRKMVGQEYASLDNFLTAWKIADKKQAIVEALQEQGVMFEALEEMVGRDYDPFDLVCHVAYGQPPLTRQERAENVRKRNYFSKYGDKARKVMECLLQKYQDEGISNLENVNVLKLKPIIELGTPVELVKAFGGKTKYRQAIAELEGELYRAA